MWRYKHFARLDRDYLGSRFVLLVRRDEWAWAESRIGFPRAYWRRWAWAHRLPERLQAAEKQAARSAAAAAAEWAAPSPPPPPRRPPERPPEQGEEEEEGKEREGEEEGGPRGGPTTGDDALFSPDALDR